MFFLERKEPWDMPNVFGGSSDPVHSYRWKAIAACEEQGPLNEIIKHLDDKTYRITNNTSMEGAETCI